MLTYQQSDDKSNNTLDSIYNTTSTAIKAMEADFTKEDGILKKQKLTVDELTKFQMEVSKFNLAAQVSSNAIKIVTDTARSIVRNMT